MLTSRDSTHTQETLLFGLFTWGHWAAILSVALFGYKFTKRLDYDFTSIVQLEVYFG